MSKQEFSRLEVLLRVQSGRLRVAAGEGISVLASEYIDDPYDYVVSANIHRRHLTTAQRGELIAALLKAKPERSDRATAKIAQVSDKTVGKVRDRLEASAEIPQSPERVGLDGRLTHYTPRDPPPARYVDLVITHAPPVEPIVFTPSAARRDEPPLMRDTSAGDGTVPPELADLVVEPPPPLDPALIISRALAQLDLNRAAEVMAAWVEILPADDQVPAILPAITKLTAGQRTCLWTLCRSKL
jgi:hypothetical protein